MESKRDCTQTHWLSRRLRRDGETREENSWIGNNPHDADGFAPPPQLESQEVALGSAPKSRGEDAQVECKETPRPRNARKRLRLTRFFPPTEMDLDCARGVAAHPGDAGGDGAIR